jgi:pimeloyl-ACP methyl ester carboxylesterase
MRARETLRPMAGAGPRMSAEPTLDPLTAYLLDATQRTILFWDVLRQRGNQYLEHMAQQAPNVLQFDADLVVDGRKLPRPVNYGLVRITPPPGVTVDQRKRPFVVVDPRAGHGPGIGGFKADSEIGVAMATGHPCYFIGFLPDPMPGQTIEDVMNAEAAFLRKVGELHADAAGKPVVIGNCQGGWAAMMVAAAYPELCGPVIVAGAPLSYWNGVRGRNPMRYGGGLNGGSWLTALSGDLGAGIFDGAYLVQNFENMNPSNTLWTKQYNLYANVDTEGPRYLGFEKWWGGHVLLNAEEMQWIVDNLFVGNKLATAEIVTSDGMRLDLRNIKGPISASARRATTSRPRSRPWAGSSTSTTTSRTSALMARPSSTASTTRSATSASSSPAAWPRRSMPSSPPTSTSSTACRRACTRRCSRRWVPKRTATGLWSATIWPASSTARSTRSARWAPTTSRTSAASPRWRACPRSISGSTARCCSPWCALR